MKDMLEDVNVAHGNKCNRNVYTTARSSFYHENFNKLKQGLIQRTFLSGSFRYKKKKNQSNVLTFQDKFGI